MSKLSKSKANKLSELHYFVDKLTKKMEKLDSFGSINPSRPLPPGIVRKNGN